MEMVVIGSDGSDYFSTEIYNIERDEWRYGPNYPLGRIAYVTALQDGISSFYVLGGYSFDVSSDIDLIYRFDEDTYEFVELNQRLPYPASVVLGAMVTMDALGG